MADECRVDEVESRVSHRHRRQSRDPERGGERPDHQRGERFMPGRPDIARQSETLPAPDQELPTSADRKHGVLLFNRGMILLRLGRGEAARDAIKLACAVDPIFSGITEATRLTVYDQHARDLAARVRAGSNAA